MGVSVWAQASGITTWVKAPCSLFCLRLQYLPSAINPVPCWVMFTSKVSTICWCTTPMMGALTTIAPVTRAAQVPEMSAVLLDVGWLRQSCVPPPTSPAASGDNGKQASGDDDELP